MSHSNRANTGLRVIVFMGAATFFFLVLMAFELKRSLLAPAGAVVPPGKATSPFREDRAWDDLERLASFGPASSGSAAMGTRRDYVAAALHSAGLKTRDFPLKNVVAGGLVSVSSVAGVVEGNRPGILILCAALDSPTTETRDMDGSDRSVANAAWLLEMARVLGSQRDGRSIWLLFLDGEAPAAPGSETGAHRGSRAVMEALGQSGERADIAAVLCVDGIGDCLLSVQKVAGAPRELAEIIWNTAARQGYGAYFGTLPALGPEIDLPFRNAGIPALALVDSSSGSAQPSGSGESCRESLRAVGDVIYHALAPLEGHLDGTGMRSNGH